MDEVVMSCRSRAGVKPAIDLLERVSNIKITSTDWHYLRQLAQERGYEMSRRRVDNDEVDEIAAELVRGIKSEKYNNPVYSFEDERADGAWNYSDGEYHFEPSSDYRSRVAGGWDEPAEDDNWPEEPSSSVQAAIDDHESLYHALKGNLTEGTLSVLWLFVEEGKDNKVSTILAEAKAHAASVSLKESASN